MQPSATPVNGTSALQALAAGIMGEKVRRNAQLTPTPGEQAARPAASPIPNHPVVGTLPDDPDIILGRLREAKREVIGVLAAIERLEVAWGRPEDVLAGQEKTDLKLLEREADRRAAEMAVADGVADPADVAAAMAPVEEAVAKRTVRRRRVLAETKSPLEALAEEVVVEQQAAASIIIEMARQQDTPETFQERLARLTAEAQAATFTQPKPDPDPIAVGVAEDMGADIENPGWVCPKHDRYVEAKSPKGRVFRKCTLFDSKECDEFERL